MASLIIPGVTPKDEALRSILYQHAQAMNGMTVHQLDAINRVVLATMMVVVQNMANKPPEEQYEAAQAALIEVCRREALGRKLQAPMWQARPKTQDPLMGLDPDHLVEIANRPLGDGTDER